MLKGHPLMAYTIAAAVDSGVFDEVVCVTDHERYAACAKHYGAKVPALRPASISGDKSPDFEWLEWIIELLKSEGQTFDAFSILRPTSPFRKPETIQRAWKEFESNPMADSIRAVELCGQHPGKMWVVQDNALMQPLMPMSFFEQPMHSMQYAALPPVYIQNASLEIAWTRVIEESRTISGRHIAPFLTVEDEGLDINNEFDWFKTDFLMEKGEANLPNIKTEPFQY